MRFKISLSFLVVLIIYSPAIWAQPAGSCNPGTITGNSPLCSGTTAQYGIASIVISQVYGGGGNSGASFTNDFIELHNRGTVAVNLSGYSVQYSSATGTTWGVTSLTGVSLQPGQYYLVQESSGGAAGNSHDPHRTGCCENCSVQRGDPGCKLLGKT